MSAVRTSSVRNTSAVRTSLVRNISAVRTSLKEYECSKNEFKGIQVQ